LSPLLALVALVSGIAGLGIAQLHLGRPLYAFRSFLGLKTSWLSREIVAAGLFVGLAALYTGLIWLPSLALPYILLFLLSDGLRTLLGLLVAASGLLTVSCSAMVYQVTPRPFWRDGSPFIKFFLTTLILGSVTGLLVGALAGTGINAMARPLYGLLMAATIIKLWYEARSFAHAKDESLTSLKKSALLMQRTLLQASQTRFISAVFGAILLPLALWGNTSETGLMVLAVMMFLLTFTGEVLERYLFFSCAVAPRMPGHPVRRRL
jgi:DMSO reductase anchor subunit